MRMPRIILPCLLLCLVASPVPAFQVNEGAPDATTPRGAVDAFIHFLKLYSGKKDLAPEQRERNDAYRARLSELIDIRRMGRIAMQDHWAKMSAAEQERFYSLFVPMVEKLAYAGNSAYFLNEGLVITWQDVKRIDDETFRVNSRIRDRKTDITIQTDYIMGRNPDTGEWALFNVMLDGSSLITDYRNQFNSIIRRWNLQRLFELMENKWKEIQEKG